MKVLVKYQIATYRGEVDLTCHEDDDNEKIYAMARNKLNRLYGPLPLGYEHYEIIGKQYDEK